MRFFCKFWKKNAFFSIWTVLLQKWSFFYNNNVQTRFWPFWPLFWTFFFNFFKKCYKLSFNYSWNLFKVKKIYFLFFFKMPFLAFWPHFFYELIIFFQKTEKIFPLIQGEKKNFVKFCEILLFLFFKKNRGKFLWAKNELILSNFLLKIGTFLLFFLLFTLNRHLKFLTFLKNTKNPIF